MTPPAYPVEIKALTSLRFLAAFWVLAYHFRAHLGLDLHRFGLIAHGWLGVDLFFLLSGFILAHVYLAATAQGGFRYGPFLKNRIARIYPLHLAALAGMICLFLAAQASGAAFEAAAFRVQDLPQNLLMIHAWGTTPHVGWNFPSWSVSAEWAAYLAFPVLAALALKGKRRPGATLALTLGAAMASVAALDVLHTLPGLGHLGQGFSEMTAQIGALRILPTFLLGIALYQFGRVRSPGLGWPLAGAGAALVLGVTLLDAHDAFAWPGFCALILGLAETARQGREGLFASRAFVFLGAASYALYMTHLGVDIVAFELLARLGITEESSLVVRAGAVAGAMLASILVAALAYLWLEEPARNAIRAWPNRAPPGWPRLTPRPAPRP